MHEAGERVASGCAMLPAIDRVVKGKSTEHWWKGNFGRFLDDLPGETSSAASASPAK